MSLRVSLLLAPLLALACADRSVGLAVPDGQLYYPLGIGVFGTGTDDQRLVVHSTNFDQRFRSGQVTLLDADLLVDGVLDRLGGSAEPCDLDQVPIVLDGFGPEALGADAWLSRVRVPGIGGGLLAVEGEGDGGPDRVYVTDRLQSLLVLIERDGDRLVCSVEGQEPPDNVDCSESYLTLTQAEDPFVLTRGAVREPDGEAKTVVAVGHLFGYLDNLESFGVVSFFDEGVLLERRRANPPVPRPERRVEGGPLSEEEQERYRRGLDAYGFLYGFRFPGVRGVSGLATTPVRPDDGLLALSGPNDPPLTLAAVTVGEAGSAAPDDTPIPVVSSGVRLDREANVSGGRGIAVTPDGSRAILSLRFEERSGVSFNAGVAIAELAGDELAVSNVLELGEELGPPALRPAGPGEPLLAYLGDLRTDEVYVVDVTLGQPRVIGELGGRVQRVVDGETINRRILDGPTGIAFVRRQGRVYGFVTNFANSTLALLDVTDPNPLRQCVLARLGRDVDADGRSETDEEA